MLDCFESISRKRTITPAVHAAALSACATETVLLNSERIEQRFGRCGIDVLASEAGLRRSSLRDAQRICRTYAVVRFTDDPDKRFGPEHAEVLAGNSLGEVFKTHGWAFHKQTLHIGAFKIDQSATDIQKLMNLSGNNTLALHIYQMLLVRNEQVFEYATVAEAHHPAYLAEDDLRDIYNYDQSANLTSESISALVALVNARNLD